VSSRAGAEHRKARFANAFIQNRWLSIIDEWVLIWFLATSCCENVINFSLHSQNRWVPSLLWRCWLGGRKGIQPVKNWVVGCSCGYLSGARCRFAYGPLMPLPLTVSCFSKIQIGFTFLVPVHLGSHGKRAVKLVYVCVTTQMTTTTTTV